MEFAPGAWRLATLPLALAPVALVASPLAALACLFAALAVLLFHRDPPRTVGEGIVSPADGTVSVVREEPDDAGRERLRVGVYMGAYDVHVNRAPLSGTVRAVDHEPGANRPAFSKDSDRNERVRVRIDPGNADATSTDAVLIAGWFARRIHPYVDPGESVDRGDRIAHVSFGSRADVVCPPGVSPEDLAVSIGDRVQAAETLVPPAACDGSDPVPAPDASDAGAT